MCTGKGHLTFLLGRRDWPRSVGDLLSIPREDFPSLLGFNRGVLYLLGCSLYARDLVQEGAMTKLGRGGHG